MGDANSRGAASSTLSTSAGLGSLQVMTVCDLGRASSIVCAERFRTVAKSFTAGAHTPADLYGNPVAGVAARGAPERVDLCGQVRSGRS
jgi:hypothetical protein